MRSVFSVIMFPVPKDYDQHKVPKLVMEPRYAMREGQEAADHASRQPYAVPLSRYGSPVPGDKVAALGQYVPMKQISNNPLAQFIPNITYWPNGDIVPFWDGPCEDDDIECELWKAKGYDTGEYVMPNPREHVDHDRWGLPLKKFGSVGKTEDSIILGEMKIEQEEMDQGVPLNVAEADAMAVLEEVVEASGVNPGTAKIEVEKALEDKNILEAAQEGEETEEQANAVLAAEEQQTQATSMEEMETQMAEAQQISANSLAKLDALRTAMARMAGLFSYTISVSSWTLLHVDKSIDMRLFDPVACCQEYRHAPCFIQRQAWRWSKCMQSYT